MKIVNIANNFKTIYLFCRDKNGNLHIEEDNSVYPYYYEIHPDGKYIGYDGKKLQKIFCNNPHEVAKKRNDNSYEADIRFTKRYMLDKIDKIESTVIKYAFIDIEVLADELPNVSKAKYPISCISVYNSFTKEVKSFYLEDYEVEYQLTEDFINYMKEEKFDIWFSWNVDFDYNYLYNRIPDFASLISPVGKDRYITQELKYPAGISIIDYLGWYKKVTLNRKKSYALDEVLQDELGEQSYGKIEFGKLTRDILDKNRNDVIRMAKLEEKYKLIPYFDEIRRLAKVDFEDLLWNSRTIDMLLLQEAKKQNIILPSKPIDNEKEDFLGAYRKAFETGRFFDIGKYDLSSAYPYAIINFCLDPANVTEEEYGNSIKIEKSYFIQNEKALLPTVVKQLINIKNNINKELKATSLENDNYKDMKTKYDAIKTIVNSAYGVMGNRFFRLYDNRVASATTFLVRDLLKYCQKRVEELKYKVIYVDTDSVFIESKEVLTQKLNQFIQDWGKKYSKDKINIEFAYEGIFEKILILAKCRYKGWLRTNKGLEPEAKGIEAKRKDSTVFMKKFQEELIKKVLNKEEKENIINWIKIKIKEIENQKFEDIAFPCKLSRPIEEYATEINREGKIIKRKPYITVRALLNTQELVKSFKKKVGDSYYYIYVKKDGEKEVLAFDETTNKHISDIDWDSMIDRNIVNKAQVIFEAMNWWKKEKRGQRFIDIFKD